MEDFKDVMLSEPPPRFAPQVSNAGGGNTMSLESYKGILLCDRPSDATKARASQQVPFLPAGRADADRGGDLGLQPSLEQKSRHDLSRSVRHEAHKTQRPTALSKHRRWLASFASAVKQMQLDGAERQVVQATKEAALRDREAAKRTQRAQPTQASDAAQVAAASESCASDTANAATAAASAKTKPKWAMTEEEELDAELEEARRLVDFAADLDYETFMEDYEVKEAMAIMRERVEEIAKEKGIDLVSEMQRKVEKGPPKERSVPVKEDEARPAWDTTGTGATLRGAVQSDALALAEKVLASSEALRHVHSKQSMARLLQDVVIGGSTSDNSARLNTQMPREPTVAGPIVATISAEATAVAPHDAPPQRRVLTEMRASKTKVQNLPYLYRCPSI